MDLTRDLCRLVERPVSDPGPRSDLPYYTDEEYRLEIADVLAGFGADPVWIFAYGSLIWRPDFIPSERRLGTVRGWHRAFCLTTTRWRGTEKNPGLMMALAPGGRCSGVVMRLDADRQAGDLEALWRREIGVKPANHRARLVTAATPDGPVRALTFAASKAGRSYVGEPGVQETAKILATAVGHWGSCADYLRQTVEALSAAGLRDDALWRLQAEVARLIIDRHRG